MDRAAWLEERRRVTEERHDTLHAATYDDQFGEIGPTHRRFVAELLRRCPPGGRVLDAACGTGKYFGMVLDAGRSPVGAWLAGAGLEAVDDALSLDGAYGYYHLLLRAPAPATERP